MKVYETDPEDKFFLICQCGLLAVLKEIPHSIHHTNSILLHHWDYTGHVPDLVEKFKNTYRIINVVSSYEQLKTIIRLSSMSLNKKDN